MDITEFLGCFTPDELKDKNKTYMNENNRPKDFLFVLKDKGTKNQGWWLKISSADELCAYYEKLYQQDAAKYLKIIFMEKNGIGRILLLKIQSILNI